jgi:glutamine amidotransferase
MNNNKTIYVVDYGLGNVGSIINMLRYIGCDAKAVADPGKLYEASKIILPGVGNFDHGMKCLHQTGMANALEKIVLLNKIPILGICLGMQLMCKSSEEGHSSGLGFVDAHVRRLSNSKQVNLKIPHMGWNDVKVKKNGTVLGDLDNTNRRFYFVHSYYVDCNEEKDIAGVSDYGGEFVSAFQVDKITGVQFHPEKSHKYGMNLLSNFAVGNL